MIISGLEANKMHFKTICFVYKQKRAFFITLCYTLLFYDINLTISPLDSPITLEFTKGFSMKTSFVTYLHKTSHKSIKKMAENCILSENVKNVLFFVFIETTFLGQDSFKILVLYIILLDFSSIFGYLKFI